MSLYLWEYIKISDLPVLVYGIGNGTDKIFSLCDKYQIAVSGIYVSDDHAINKTIHGLQIEPISNIYKQYQNAILLLGFGIYQPDVISRVRNLGKTYEVFVPDLPLIGGPEINPEWIEKNRNQIKRVRDLFADEQSKKCFDNCIKSKISGRIEYLDEIHTSRYNDWEILELSENEDYLDLGAYNGDTIMEFIQHTRNKYHSITALEPDAHNFKKLQASVASVHNVTLLPFAAWSASCKLTFAGKSGRNVSILPDLPGRYKHIHEVDSIAIDELHQTFSFIKFDVEGAEREAILGMKRLIETEHPKMLVSVYHKTDDFIQIPLLIDSIYPGYRFYFRKNPCLPAWELQLYCV